MLRAASLRMNDYIALINMIINIAFASLFVPKATQDPTFNDVCLMRN